MRAARESVSTTHAVSAMSDAGGSAGVQREARSVISQRRVLSAVPTRDMCPEVRGHVAKDNIM